MRSLFEEQETGLRHIPWKPVKGKMTLRGYQVDRSGQNRELLQTHPSTLMVLATGGGKTICFADIALSWPDGWGRVLVICDKLELIEQACVKIHSHAGIRPAVEQADRRDVRNPNDRPKVLVASRQTLANPTRLKLFDPHEFGLIIVDECHHAVTPSYQVIFKWFGQNPQLRILGVTATPERTDKKAMGNVFKSASRPWDISTGIDEGFLVDLIQKQVFVHNIDLRDVKTSGDDFTVDSLERTILGGKAGHLGAADADATRKRMETLHAIAKPCVDEARGQQGLIFMPGVQSSLELAIVLRTDYGMKAEAVWGEMDPQSRQDIIQEYQRGNIQCLTNCGVLCEGFDAPGVRWIGCARPTKSRSLKLQIIGRGTRALPGVVDGPATPAARREAIAASGKPHCTVLEFCGNAGRHKLISSTDVLAGEPLTDEERDLVDAILRGDGQTAREAIKQARAEIREKQEAARLKTEARKQTMQAKHKSYKANVNYSTQIVGERGESKHAAKVDTGAIKEGATWKQIHCLVRMGFDKTFASGLTKRAASAIIAKGKQKEREQQTVPDDRDRNGEECPF